MSIISLFVDRLQRSITIIHVKPFVDGKAPHKCWVLLVVLVTTH